MKKYGILSIVLLLGIVVFGVASADSIVVAGAKRQVKPKTPSSDVISCCNSNGSCQVTRRARCTIQGGSEAPGTCSETPPTLDPVCSSG